MTNFIKNLTHIGINHRGDYRTKRSIIVANALTLVILLALFSLWASMYIGYGQVSPTRKILSISIFIVPFILNFLRLTTLSRLYLCYAPPALLLSTLIKPVLSNQILLTTDYDTYRIFLLTFSIIPYLLFHRREWVLLAIGVIPCLLSIAFFDPVLTALIPSYSDTDLHGAEYKEMSLRTIISYIIISGGCWAFTLIIEASDNHNDRLIGHLQSQSEKIQRQNEQLKAQQDDLAEANDRLSFIINEKTRNLKERDLLLMKYAFTNAHKVRAPLARILGLLMIARHSPKEDLTWFVGQIEREAGEIDFLLKEISKDLSEVDTEDA